MTRDDMCIRQKGITVTPTSFIQLRYYTSYYNNMARAIATCRRSKPSSVVRIVASRQPVPRRSRRVVWSSQPPCGRRPEMPHAACVCACVAQT